MTPTRLAPHLCAACDIPDQIGRRAIVTGGNNGIGWHTALELARAGAEVMIAARDMEGGCGGRPHPRGGSGRSDSYLRILRD